MKDKESIFTTLILTFFLAGLPLGSFFYLKSGLNFFRENMSNLEPKGTALNFTATDQNGNTLSLEDMKGKVYLTSFFDTECGEACDKTASQLLRIQEQFKNRADIFILSHSLKPAQDSTEKLKAYAEEKLANSKRWFFLNGDERQIAQMAASGGEDFKNIPVHQKLMLVDDSLRVRNFYDVHNEESFLEMARHIAYVMPRIPEKEIKYRPEKEK